MIIKKFFAHICPVTSFSMTTNDFSFPVFCEFRFFRQTLQASLCFVVLNQGRRAPLRFALAPGFHISRRWRLI